MIWNGGDYALLNNLDDSIRELSELDPFVHWCSLLYFGSRKNIEQGLLLPILTPSIQDITQFLKIEDYLWRENRGNCLKGTLRSY